MSSIEIKNWGKDAKAISEELLEESFPRPEYRVSPKLYRAREIRPSGTARAGLLFVLDGKCRCSFGGGEEISIILDAGQYIDFPEGSYRIEPLDNKDARIAFVWNVEKLFKELFPDHPSSR